MTDYISREAAIDATRKVSVGLINPTTGAWDLGFTNALSLACNSIAAIPAADVRPVVKAKWEWNDNNGYYYCGNCEAVSPREDQYGEYIDCPNFCPSCGADMREKQT